MLIWLICCFPFPVCLREGTSCSFLMHVPLLRPRLATTRCSIFQEPYGQHGPTQSVDSLKLFLVAWFPHLKRTNLRELVILPSKKDHNSSFGHMNNNKLQGCSCKLDICSSQGRFHEFCLGLFFHRGGHPSRGGLKVRTGSLAGTSPFLRLIARKWGAGPIPLLHFITLGRSASL